MVAIGYSKPLAFALIIGLLIACDGGERFGGSATDEDSLSAVSSAIEAVEASAPVPISMKVTCFSRMNGWPLVSLTKTSVPDTASWITSYEPGFTIVHVIDEEPRIATVDFRPAVEEDSREVFDQQVPDSASAVEIALRLARRTSDAPAQFHIHCVEDLANGWVVTMIKRNAEAGIGQPVNGLLIGIQRDGEAGLIGRF